MGLDALSVSTVVATSQPAIQSLAPSQSGVSRFSAAHVPKLEIFSDGEPEKPDRYTSLLSRQTPTNEDDQTGDYTAQSQSQQKQDQKQEQTRKCSNIGRNLGAAGFAFGGTAFLLASGLWAKNVRDGRARESAQSESELRATTEGQPDSERRSRQ